MKSSLRIIGAGELSNEALSLEQAGDRGDSAYIDAHQKELSTALMSLKDLISPVVADTPSEDLS